MLVLHLEQIEGKICIEAALKARHRKITLLILRHGLHQKQIQAIIDEAERQNVPIKYVSQDEIDAMAHGKTHGGMLALATPKPPISLETLLDQLKRLNHCPALLLLEGIDDNQNLGFTLRTAEALGIDAVLLKKHLWNFDTNTVSRASSGAYERLPIMQLDQIDKALPRLKNLGLTVFGCIPNARRTMYEVDLTKPLILTLGGEKRGLSAAMRAHCDVLIKIPMLTDIGSLSLSHSASIAMAEMMRQRLSHRVTCE